MSQPHWLTLAWADLGVTETPGPAHTARVLAYYADAGHPQITDDETAWCAAFLGACLERAELGSTRSLMARSYLSWGDPLEEFRPGAIAVLSRTADPALGHVAFIIGETPDRIVLLGGNQNNSVSVEAFPRSRLLGLRWPSGPLVPEAEATRDRADDDHFGRALAHVLEMEGGWTDDPHDPGGPTNLGITLATYARHKDVELTSGNVAELKAELRAISPETVRRIYLERYWRPASCEQMPPALAFFHFDAAVNQGVTGSARLLQEAVGAFVDGEIGPETLAKAAAGVMATTLTRYADARRRHYRSLSTFWRFGRGWLTRVDRTLDTALEIARTSPSTNPQQEHPPMSESNPSTDIPAAPDSKWWGRSMTIWGVLITALSTVMPVLGPVVGLDITAELVRQVGDQVVVVVQAAGGLAGTILAIWGRARATTSLERKQVTMSL